VEDARTEEETQLEFMKQNLISEHKTLSDTNLSSVAYEVYL